MIYIDSIVGYGSGRELCFFISRSDGRCTKNWLCLTYSTLNSSSYSSKDDVKSKDAKFMIQYLRGCRVDF